VSSDSNTDIIEALAKAYNAELETVMNYVANSTNLDGVRAKNIAGSLQADIAEELNHAQVLARRIKTIGGLVPGSEKFRATQDSLQPPAETTDVIAVIKGVIDAEEAAIRMYKHIIEISEGRDHPTQDLAIEILQDEEQHRREFIGFLKEYEQGA